MRETIWRGESLPAEAEGLKVMAIFSTMSSGGGRFGMSIKQAGEEV